jgi:hypothetical protein
MVAMVDHALASHLGRVGGEHGGDQRAVEQFERLAARNAFLFEPVERRRHVGTGFGGDPLPVLGEVGEHREQHEAADEGEGVVEAERVEPRIDRIGIDDAARAVDRIGSDIFDPPEQLLAAIGPDHVAEQAAEEADVGILGDGRGAGHGRMLRRTQAARQCRKSVSSGHTLK